MSANLELLSTYDTANPNRDSETVDEDREWSSSPRGVESPTQTENVVVDGRTEQEEGNVILPGGVRYTKHLSGPEAMV